LNKKQTYKGVRTNKNIAQATSEQHFEHYNYDLRYGTVLYLRYG
jgi:hypothetical protein